MHASVLLLCILSLFLPIINTYLFIKPGKSVNDKREYLAVMLSNKLKVLFIQDTELALGGCSISIGAGRFLDRDRSKGLAHFLQHMVFMGSKKYPQQNQFSAFIQSKSGSDNAYTTDRETNYYSFVDNQAIIEAVQRMTDFIIQPLIRQQSINKQRQAVHNQYSLRIGDEGRRKWQLLRRFAAPPFSKFNMGNNQTLSHSLIREDLIWFHKKYYSSNIINVAIMSNIPVDDIRKKLAPLLQKIPNKNVKLPSYGKHFTPSQTGKFVFVQSIKNQSSLQFFWIVDFLRPHFRKHVIEYISYVLANQGKNSLLSTLKLKNYAYKVIFFNQDIKPQSIIDFQIKLTKRGEKYYKSVYNLVIQYISSIQPIEYIYEEIKQRNLASFNFRQTQSVEEYVSGMTQRMHYVPLNQIVNYTITFDQFEEAKNVIKQTLSQMTPENLIVMFSSPRQIQGSKQQKFLKAKFYVKDLPQIRNKRFKFKPLLPNPYMPIQLKYHEFEDDTLVPTKYDNNTYFLQDSTYGTCKGGVELRIFSNQNLQFIQFYANYLNLLLKQISYPAQILSTSVQYDISTSLIITIFGYSDTVLKLIQNIGQHIKTIHNGKKSQIIYNIAYQDYLESYLNSYRRNSEDIAAGLLKIVLIQKVRSYQKTLEQIADYEYGLIKQRIENFWKNNFVKVVAVGNFQEQSLLKLFQIVAKNMSAQNNMVQLFQYRCLKLKRNITISKVIDSSSIKTSCAIVYYQAGNYEQETFYKLNILKQLISEPYTNELRTIKKFSYTLDVEVDNSRGVLGLKFMLVSSSIDPKRISDQIKKFVNSFFSQIREKLTANNESLLKQTKQVVANQFRASANYQSFFDFITEEISKKTFYFERNSPQQVNKYLQEIKITDLQKLWQQIRSRTLDILVVGQPHLEQFKKKNVKSYSIQTVKNKSQYWDDFFY